MISILLLWSGLIGYFFCHVGLITNRHGNLVKKKQTIGLSIPIMGQYVLGGILENFLGPCWSDN